MRARLKLLLGYGLLHGISICLFWMRNDTDIHVDLQHIVHIEWIYGEHYLPFNRHPSTGVLYLVTIRTLKSPPKSAAEFSQLLQPNDHTSYQYHMHAPIKVLQSMVAQDVTLLPNRTTLKNLKQRRGNRVYERCLPLTMMLCDNSELIESNRTASYQFEHGDIELMDHDTLQRYWVNWNEPNCIVLIWTRWILFITGYFLPKLNQM